MLNAYAVKTNQPDLVGHIIRVEGGNGAAPTALSGGGGVTVTRTGEGAYTLTWADDPGTFVAWDCNLGAVTPGDLAGHTASRGAYASKALSFVLYNASDAADDLLVNEFLDIIVWFKRTNVEG